MPIVVETALLALLAYAALHAALGLLFARFGLYRGYAGYLSPRRGLDLRIGRLWHDYTAMTGAMALLMGGLVRDHGIEYLFAASILCGVIQIVVGLLIVAAVLESVFGFCLGCVIFGFLQQRGVIPEDVCEACNNIWLRNPEQAPADTH